MTAEVADIVWAKSSGTAGLSVVRHLCDVAAVAYELLDDRGWGRHLTGVVPLGLDSDQTRRWVAYLIGCHDLGKATPGFQAKWHAGRQRVAEAGLRFPPSSPDRHDAGSDFFLRTLVLPARGLSLPDSALLAGAVASHHGFGVPPTEYAKFGAGGLARGWRVVLDEIDSVLAETLGISGIPAIPNSAQVRAGIAVWLAGLCSVCDWVGSNEEYFSPDRPRLPYGQWFQASRILARRAISELGIQTATAHETTRIGSERALLAALPPGCEARPLQVAVLDAAAEFDAASPSTMLFVIEAPMGEGKTEAAFAIDALLRERCGHAGTYIAMPTQATSNALLARFAEYLDRLQLDGPAQLQLAHGSASIADLRIRLHEIGFGAGNRAVAAAAWLSGRKRTLLAQHAIGTVDQALVGVLNARHHFVRLFGLSRRLVVLDEVHAYDTYTSGLIERLVAWLAQLGCSVVVMSATLPRKRRSSLVRAFGAEDMGTAAYPRISVVSGGRAVFRTVEPSRTWSMNLSACPSDVDWIADHAAAMARDGARVLVIVNKVGRAQTLSGAIRERGAEVLLFHARYPMDERLARERDVLTRFGKGAPEHGGSVLIATQVAEQSLDIDLDILITDIAPVDLVLQRAGRIHRHIRTRPKGYEQPRVLVAGLGAEGIPEHALTSYIYENLPVLRSACWLRTHPLLRLPVDIDRAVSFVYDEESLPATADGAMELALATARIEREAEIRKQSEWARLAALPPPADWEYGVAASPLDDDDAAEGACRFGTRLGQESIACIPIFQLAEALSVSGGSPDWPLSGPIPDAIARTLAGRYLRLSLPPLVHALRKQTPLPGWRQRPELQAYVPVVLDAKGLGEVAGLRVRLDPELGLLYERHQEA